MTEPDPTQPLIPPWKAFPDTSPDDIHWRMGPGESYIGMFWNRLGPQSDEARWAYFRQQLPIPPEWLPIVADALTGSEDNEQVFFLQLPDCDRVLDHPTSFPGVRQLAASGLCDFADFATWLRANTLYHDQISSFEPTLYDSLLEILRAWKGPIVQVSFTYSPELALSVQCHSNTELPKDFLPLPVTEPGNPFRDAFVDFLDNDQLRESYTDLARRLHTEKTFETLFGHPVRIVVFAKGMDTPNEALTRIANPKSLQAP